MSSESSRSHETRARASLKHTQRWESDRSPHFDPPKALGLIGVVGKRRERRGEGRFSDLSPRALRLLSERPLLDSLSFASYRRLRNKRVCHITNQF